MFGAVLRFLHSKANDLILWPSNAFNMLTKRSKENFIDHSLAAVQMQFPRQCSPVKFIGSNGLSQMEQFE